MSKSKLSKVYQFVARLVRFPEKEEKGYLKYDTDNKFPQRLIQMVDESPTATSCIEKKVEYTVADGFVDRRLNDIMVNPTQNSLSLLAETAQQVAIFEAVCWKITRRADGNIGSISLMPFELVRRKNNGDFIYNITFGYKQVDSNQNITYSKFLGLKIDSNQLQQLTANYPDGEILYHFRKKPGKFIYPVSSWYSASEDIYADAEFGKFKLETVNNSFLPSGFLTFVGDIDNETKDDYGKTEQDYLEDTLMDFTGMNRTSNGDTGRSKLAVFHAKTKDEVPVFQGIDNSNVLNAANASRKETREIVASAFGVPSFLIGVEGSVGFATKIIQDNIALFNDSLEKSKQLIEEAFKMVLPNFDWKISTRSPIKDMPQWLIDVLLPDEKRALGDYKPLQQQTQQSEPAPQPIPQNLFNKSKLAINDYTSKELEVLSDMTIENVTKEDIDARYNEYYNTVNMTFTELKRWSESDCSKKASGSGLPVARNLELLNINKSDWTAKHYRWAGQTIKFINNLKNEVEGDIVDTCNMSRRNMTLKNWAFDFKKLNNGG